MQRVAANFLFAGCLLVTQPPTPAQYAHLEETGQLDELALRRLAKSLLPTNRTTRAAHNWFFSKGPRRWFQRFLGLLMCGNSLNAFLFAQKMNSIQTETFPEIYERHIKALVH